MRCCRMIYRWLAIMAVVSIAVAVSGCLGNEETLVEATPQTVHAMVHNVSDSSLAATYVTSGTVASDHQVVISSRLSGYIRGMKVREGSLVQKGDLLFRIDPVDAREALLQAEADLADAESDMQRFKSLLADDAISKQQFDKAQLRYKVAKSKVAQARNQLTYAEVRAPLSGVIIDKKLDNGDLASAGMAILVLEDPSHLLVETYVPERYLADIRQGDEVELHVASVNMPILATVRQIVQAADTGSYKFLVKLTLPDRKGVYPGMFARVVFNIGQRKGVVIPESSVVRRNGLAAVYLVDDENILRYRLVRLGAENSGGVEVVSGLTSGQRIVHDPGAILQIRSGMRVAKERLGDD